MASASPALRGFFRSLDGHLSSHPAGTGDTELLFLSSRGHGRGSGGHRELRALPPFPRSACGFSEPGPRGPLVREL